MNKTITFKVRHDSEFYTHYFAWEKANEDFKKLTGEFLAKYLPNSTNAKTLFCERLTIQLEPDDQARYREQILPNQIWYNGERYWRFKRESHLNKCWLLQVYRRTDTFSIHRLQAWESEFGGHAAGSKLWHKGKDVFGQIEVDADLLKVPYWVEKL